MRVSQPDTRPQQPADIAVPVEAATTPQPATTVTATRPLVLLGILLDLTLILAVIYQFQLVSRSFFHVTMLAAAGFGIHAQLPVKHRLPFFALLSIASLGVAFGAGDGIWLFTLGAVLLALCHLPVGFRLKVAIILAAGAGLGVLRTGVIELPWSSSIWPILGSMFMFRTALYLHALRYEKTTPTVARGVSYFFMLPNVCFPLFPVVDYSTFNRTYYEGEEQETYRRGVTWIVRGLVHLLAYRFVYLHLVVDPAEIADIGTLTQHLLSTFLLYLRVSGEFHLVVGMLHLFGFRLPETHRLYYLASSFTDFWRRINIYWKDFMMKLVYYPSFFRLRRWGMKTALVMSTIIVFLGTWLLHSYQWFWLRGSFPLTLSDGLFWGVLGGLVVVNTLREAAGSRKRRRGSRGWSARLAVQTVATFAALCILWSLWSAESVSKWMWMWTAAGRADATDLLWIGGLLALGLAVAGRNWGAPATPAATPSRMTGTPYIRSRVLLVVLLLSVIPGALDVLSTRAAETVASLQRPRLNDYEQGLEHRGYYERMDNVDRLSSQLWQAAIATRPASWVPLTETPAYRRRDDFLYEDLVPSVQTTFFDVPFSTNSWGMRDREVALVKPPGTYRIALLGPSFIMGHGVADGQTIDTFLEERLARELGQDGTQFEVLNFGVNAYSLTQQAALVEERVLPFSPDMIIMADGPGLNQSIVGHLLEVLYAGIEIPDPELAELLRSTGADKLGAEGRPVPFDAGRALASRFGVASRMPWNEADARLRLATDDILAWCFGYVDREARNHGAVPVFALLDVVRDDVNRKDVSAVGIAERSGLVSLDLRDVYGDAERTALRVAPYDRHPNADANRMIADRLFEELQRRGLFNLNGAARGASAASVTSVR